MTIEASLRAACDELGWTPLQLSAFAGKKSTEPAKAWLSGKSTPPGRVILRLILTEPVFRKHLLGDAA